MIAALGIDARGRGHGYDLAGFLPFHLWCDGHASVHAGLDVDIEDPGQHFLRAIGRRAGRHQILGIDIGACRGRRALVGEGYGAAAGVADGDVETTEFGDDIRDGLVGGGAVGQVGFQRHCANAEGLALRRHRVGGQRRSLEFVDFRGLQIAVDDRDIGAQPRQPQRIAATEAAGPAGDQGNLAVQFTLAHYFVPLMVGRRSSK